MYEPVCEVQLGKTDRSVIQDSAKKPRSTWRRRVVWIGVITPLGIVAGVLVIGQTSVMRLIVEPILEDQLGVDVSTGSIHLMPTGEIVINDAVFKASSIANRAGSLIEFEQASISMNWWGVLKGSGQVRSMVIDKPMVRVSQDIESGVLNLAAMKFKDSGGGGGAMPAIEITNGILQIGEHDADSYRVLKELSIRGQLTEQTSTGVSAFDFLALPIESSLSSSMIDARGSFGLTGQISQSGIAGVLDGVRLEDWPAEIVPSRSRGMYQRLALAGDLAPTRFHVSPDGLIEVVLTLEGVELNLPFDETGSMSGSIVDGDLLRMRQTRGVVRFGTTGFKAQLKGLIDELEYDVDLDVQGLDAQSPFDVTLVTDFRLDDNFKPAQFLPAKVMSKLERFEDTIADVHALVRVSRGAGAQSEIKVSGRAELSNASATYKKFRYPISQMSGVIEFDPDKLVVRDITGVGPTGATLVANGVFSPLGEQSVVKLDLRAQGVAIDKHLLAALDHDQRKLVDSLFSTEDYAYLVDESLVLTDELAIELGELRRSVWDRLDQWQDGVDGDESARRALGLELASVDRKLLAPIFEFGGAVDVDVSLVRHPERAADDRWTTDIRALLSNAGLVPSHFPIPIMANDVEIVINETSVELTGGQYSGLTGGQAWVDVAIDLTQENIKPIIEIQAREFPIDPSLISAIPGYRDGQSPDPDDISLRRILDRLNLTGMLECDAIIGPRSDGRLGYDIESTVLSGSARPAGLSRGDDLTLDPLALDDLYGTIYVTEELIIVDLEGMLSSPEQPLAPTPIQVTTQLTMPSKTRGLGGVKRVDGLLPTEFGPALPGPLLYATAYVDGMDLAMPLEHAVAVVSPRIARELLEYRTVYQPDGMLGVHARLEGVIGGAVESSFTLDGIQGLGFDFQDIRYRVGTSWGRAQFVLSEQPTISFEDFRIPIEGDGESAGELSLDGEMMLARGGRYIEITKDSDLDIHFQGGAFESPISQGVIGQFSNGDQDSWFQSHQLGGRFDLDVTLRPELGMHKITGVRDSIRIVPTLVMGSLHPKSISMMINEQVARFDEVSGVVRFDGFEGEFDSIRASDATTSLGLDGRWSMRPGEGLALDLDVGAHGDLLSGPIRAILPGAVDRVIESLDIRSSEPVSIDDLHIQASGLGTEDGGFEIDGSAQLINGSAVIGLELTGIAGELGFGVKGTNDTLGYEIELEASRLRAGLMRVHDARIKIIGDANNEGVVLIPEIQASMHGGRIAGSAQVRPNAEGEPHYWMELHASGVRAAPVFDDLLSPPEGLVGPPRPGQTMVLSSWSQADDLSRGAMIGDLTMTGLVGDVSKRSGRGLLEVSGGSVALTPGLIPLIEASNLSLPAGSPLNHAQASFYVDGQTMAFEQISASSKRIEILGYGTMDWGTRDVDLRFRSRSVNPIPILSGLIEQLRDELITTRVTGKMGEIKYSVSQFNSTRRLFNAMLGNAETEQQRRMREVEEQVQESRFRSGQERAQTVHQPISEVVGSRASSWDWDDSGLKKTPASSQTDSDSKR